MNSKPNEEKPCVLKEEFILFLPFTQASGCSLDISLSKDMNSGEVMVNGKKLYGKMVDMTCVFASNFVSQKKIRPDAMSRVLVCQEEKFESDSSIRTKYFSVQTSVKATKMTRKRRPKRRIPVRVKKSAAIGAKKRIKRVKRKARSSCQGKMKCCC